MRSHASTIPSCMKGDRYEKYQLKMPFVFSNLVPDSEKAMASHSSTLAWKIPWTEEPGGLHSMGSRRVRHD